MISGILITGVQQTKYLISVLFLGIGLQFDVSQKGFIGADLTMIPKKEVEYEYKSHSNFTVSHLDEKIDLGVTVIGIFAGLNF